ncbi:9319_t:CDS:2 [Entrophospora sp. SA101]|nr:9319_t:CDS:2 [Entrophospora sp. SA101]
MVPLNMTINECIVLTHLTAAAIYVNKTALQGFLLWRLRNIGDDDYKKNDLYIGTFAQFFKLTPEAFYDEKEKAYYCSQGVDMARTPVLGFLLTDLLIDIYVTLRFTQILNKANETESLMVGGTKGRKIRLSYAITVDAEIVRMIEGKKKPSPINSKSFKNTSRRPARNVHDSLIVNEGEPKELSVNITSINIINQDDRGIVNESETKKLSVKITNNDAIINRGIINEGETKELSVNITNNDAIINQDDRGIVNEGETKESSVNITI